VGPGPFDPSRPAAELVMLLLGTIAVLVVFTLGDLAVRALRRRFSRSVSRTPEDGV